uniref:Uncharacterized protein n=1 Tax=Salvator merianae TaxID=96440 RepID=A0A8D0B0W2_SALMN
KHLYKCHDYSVLKSGKCCNDYLPKSQSVNAEYYSKLCQLKDVLEEKRRGKLWKGFFLSFFLQDNALSHNTGDTIDVLTKLWFQCMDHPPYSPDLAPSDYFLFPNLKKSLKGQHFFETFLEGLQKLQTQCAKCVELWG